MPQNLACVVHLPGFAGRLGRELPVEADEQVDQLTANGLGAQQLRQFRQVDEPLRLPGSPVIVGSVDDTEHTMVGLARLMQQPADRLQSVRHLVPHRAENGSRGRLAVSRCRRHQGHHGRSTPAASSPRP